MLSKDLYRRFVNLCEKWPKDNTKVGRDYAEYFRRQIGVNFPHGELGQVQDPKAVEESISALERIANNLYYNENPLKRSSASGLEAWACRLAISNDGIREIQEQDEVSLINKLKRRLGISFLASPSNHRVADQHDSGLESKRNDKDKIDT